jgi:GABA(A) receptor-associated protein
MFISDKKFVDQYSLFERSKESERIMSKFADRIPVICEKNRHDLGCPDIDKHKYLVPHNITLGQFMYVIRKRIQLPASSALFLFVGEDATVLPVSLEMEYIYHRFKNKDGFLYILYSRENVFG